MTQKRVHVVVKGRVQGVFFRAYTSTRAKSFNLTGWVRNVPNGDVEALLEGETTEVDKMLAWFHTGSPHSRVDDIQVREDPPMEEFSTFEILY